MAQNIQNQNFMFGNRPADFVLEGGTYYVCWCANMPGLTCTTSEDFKILTGALTVFGPFRDQEFNCSRSQDCTGLPFQGIGLSTDGSVSLTMFPCGSRLGSVQLSPYNVEGIASIQSVGDRFELDFGRSNATHDYGISLDAQDLAWNLCWCGQDCNEAERFVVSAGQLRVLGPRTHQEIRCYIGQPCLLNETDVEFESNGAMNDDRIMVLSACGTGTAIPGVPGNSAVRYDSRLTLLRDLKRTRCCKNSSKSFTQCARRCRQPPLPASHEEVKSTEDQGSFQFDVEGGLLKPEAVILQSIPGIFRLCFCRPSRESDCATPRWRFAKIWGGARIGVQFFCQADFVTVSMSTVSPCWGAVSAGLKTGSVLGILCIFWGMGFFISV